LILLMKNSKMILKKFSHVLKQLLLKLLWLYQKFFTLIGFGSCRYYPTCSEYARLNFENNSISSAFYHSFTRILRCNQLFDGGIDYPTLDKLCQKPAKLGVDSIKYWLVPNQKNRYYIIKNFSYKG
jgi:putative membrane protein insertion efficiency factor